MAVEPVQTFSGIGTLRSSPAGDAKGILRVDMVFHIPLLTTDDAVKSRTVTCRWNVVNRYGALGDFYFMMLQSDKYEKQSDYDSDGNQVYTMLRKRNPIMELS